MNKVLTATHHRCAKSPASSQRVLAHLLRLSLGLVVMVSVACCGPTQYNPPAVNVVDADEAPSYAELVRQYNAHVEPLDALYARTFIEMYWKETDEQGNVRDRKEIGGGKLIVLRPGRIAMTVEKLGTIYLWAGSDGREFWLIDRVDQDRPKAALGQVGLSAGQMPLGIDPQMLPLLMGLSPLEPESGFEVAPVQETQDAWVIEPPGLQARLFLDRETSRPLRVELLDDQGEPRVVSTLDGLLAVDAPDTRRLRGPRMPESADIYAVGESARLTLAIREAEIDPDRMRDQWFDFPALRQALGVAEQDVHPVRP